MSDWATRSSPGETEASARDPAEEELDELRRLLLAPEKKQLGQLQERLDDPQLHAEDVSRVLPDAVALRTARDNQLTEALMPSVEEAIAVSVKNRPQTLVDAIFPVMGPAIRKAISNAFSEMVQSLNQALEYSVSIKGLKWRLEALRTGKSFAEVVLRHTLLYKVEQVFLIHKETGLLLDHVAADSETYGDADLVSGMLTAIQDFVHDSFNADRDDTLESLQVGELTVWIERGPKAVLAAVIRGTAPYEFRRVMQDSLDRIHFDLRYELDKFQGDTSPFHRGRPHLENCLQMQVEEKTKKASPLLWAIAGAVVLALGAWMFFIIRDNRRWSDYVDKLKAEPGIMVVSAEKQSGMYVVSGLRDPLANDPVSILKTTDLDPDSVTGRWEAYQSSHPQFVLTRAKDLLQPPETVTLKVEGGALKAEGFASSKWVEEARRMARALTGITRFDETGLSDADSGIARTRQRIESLTVEFELGKAEIAASENEKLDNLMVELKILETFLASAEKSARILILGFTDRTGTETINRGLSRERAENTLSAILSKGFKNNGPVRIEVGANGALSAEREYNRRAAFKVVPEDSAVQNR